MGGQETESRFPPFVRSLARPAAKLIQQIVGSRFHSKQPVPLAVTHGNSTRQFAPLDTPNLEKKIYKSFQKYMCFRTSVRPSRGDLADGKTTWRTITITIRLLGLNPTQKGKDISVRQVKPRLCSCCPQQHNPSGPKPAVLGSNQPAGGPGNRRARHTPVVKSRLTAGQLETPHPLNPLQHQYQLHRITSSTSSGDTFHCGARVVTVSGSTHNS